MRAVPARTASDTYLRQFAERLPDHYEICDLRERAFPVGLVWNPTVKLVRDSERLLFAQEISASSPQSLWRRVFKSILPTKDPGQGER